jgi:addiction module HigA family antidote
MARKPVAIPESDLAVHPGELLAEELAVRGLTQKQLAEGMGRPAQAINEIIRGRTAITAETALQLEHALGTPARFWLNLQAAHDLAGARQREQAARSA